MKYIQPFSLFEEATSIGYEAYRYHGKHNKVSDLLRGGTFYSPMQDVTGERYKLQGTKLGGTFRREVHLAATNPYELITPRGQCADFVARSYAARLVEEVRFLTSTDAAFIIDVAFADERQVNRLLRRADFISDQTKALILKQPFFNRQTMSVENLLAHRLRQSSYDLLIVTDPEKRVGEYFDFNGLAQDI